MSSIAGTDNAMKFNGTSGSIPGPGTQLDTTIGEFEHAHALLAQGQILRAVFNQILNGVLAQGDVWAYRALLSPANDVIEILRSQHRTMCVAH